MNILRHIDNQLLTLKFNIVQSMVIQSLNLPLDPLSKDLRLPYAYGEDENDDNIDIKGNLNWCQVFSWYEGGNNRVLLCHSWIIQL